MKKLFEIQFALIILLSMFSSTTKAQSINTSIDKLDSYMSIKLGTKKQEIKDSMIAGSGKNTFILEKVSLDPMFKNEVKRCILTFNKKSVLSEITLIFATIPFPTNTDSVKKAFFKVFSPIWKQLGKQTKQESLQGHMSATWIGEIIELDYVAEHKIDLWATALTYDADHDKVEIRDGLFRQITLKLVK